MPTCPTCEAVVADAGCATCRSERAAADDAAPFDRGSLRFALRYPVWNGYDQFLLGAIIGIIGSVVPFVGLLPHGYGFRLTRAAAAGETDIPAFDGPKRLFVDGVRVWIGALVIAAVTLVAGVSITAGIQAVGLGGPVQKLSMAVVALAGLYLLPAILTTYATTGRATAAFSQRHAGAFAARREYAVTFLGWLLLLAGTVVVSVLSLVTVLGPMVVIVYAIYVSSALWGYHYRTAVADGVVPSVAAAQSQRTQSDGAAGTGTAGAERTVAGPSERTTERPGGDTSETHSP